MPSPSWRSSLVPPPGDRGLASWLTEPGSLTARCQAACRQFRLRLLAQGPDLPMADEVLPAAGFRPGQRAWVREVLLECDGVPVIYAHTILARQPRGRLTRWLAGLGSRSLGSLLFSHPGFRRGEIQFRRLDGRHPLYRRAAAVLPGRAGASLWARRSLHRFDSQAVLVTEVFLPPVLALGQPR